MKTALRWIGAVLSIVVFLMLLMIAVGTTLPINHTSTCATKVAAPPAKVWSTLADPLDFAWRTDITSARIVQRTPALEWSETDRYGHAILYQRVSAEPRRHLVNRIADPTLPYGGTWTYDLTPAPALGATTVSIVENGEIFNPVFRFLARFFIGYTGTMRQHLTDLGKSFGQTVNVSCVTPSESR